MACTVTEFIQGWRKKFGCGLLLVASAVTLAWVRSLSLRDEIQIPWGESSFLEIISDRGFLHVNFYHNIPSNPPIPNWQSRGHLPGDHRVLYRELSLDERLNWRLQFWGSDTGNLYSILPACDGFNETFLAAPYWGVALPLSLISAGLLVRRSGKSSSKSSESMGTVQRATE